MAINHLLRYSKRKAFHTKANRRLKKVNRSHFYINRSRDVRLNCYNWVPDKPNQARAVIQLAHGMAEHILRYDNFAKYLTAQGYIVYGHDHRGHGGSVMAPDDWGFFADTDGFEKVVEDMHAISNHIHEQHPTLSLILFGHSMGSFLTRRYIQLYGEQLAGVILSGTGGSQGLTGKAGRLVAAMEANRIGRRTPSKWMDQLTFGSFNKSFEPTRTAFDFLSRNDKAVDTYIEDTKCGFICSAQFYRDLLYGIELIHRPEEIAPIPPRLPIYLIAGAEDPVGDHGKGVQQVYNQYVATGLRNVTMTLYPNARHEILHELNQEEIYTDISAWLHHITP